MGIAASPQGGDTRQHCLGKVRAARPRLSDALAKVADLALAEPALFLDRSISEVAARAGASPATVTRFCRALGYSSWLQFRVGLASDLGRDLGAESVGESARDAAYESWRSDIGREFGPEDAPSDVLATLLQAQIAALETTAALVDLEDVSRVAKAIWELSHLDVYGIGGSGEMAAELTSRLYRIGVNAHSWSEVHSGLASAAILTDEAVAIGISNSGRTTETIEMLRLARSSGALTVAVTSDARSPLAKSAEVCLVNATPKQYLQPDDLAAKHAQLLVLDLLYLLVAQQDYAVTADRLALSRVAVTAHRQPAEKRTKRRGTRRRSTEPRAKQATAR